MLGSSTRLAFKWGELKIQESLSRSPIGEFLQGRIYNNRLILSEGTMLWTLWLVTLVLAVKIQNYNPYGDSGRTFLACAYALKLTGTVCPAVNQYLCYCHDTNGFALLIGCAQSLGHNDSHFANYAEKYCLKYYNGSVNMTFWSEALQVFHEKAKKPSDIPNFNFTKVYGVPLIANRSQIHSLDTYYRTYLGNLDNLIWYGVGSVGYWFLLAIISGCVHWAFILAPRLRFFFDGRISKFVRKNITLPALRRRTRNSRYAFNRFVECIVPSRLESLAILGFIALQIAVNGAQLYYHHGDLVFDNQGQAITRYIADRTGIVSTVLTPLLLLFGGRNNFLQWVSGWKFSTMITFHRWIARLVVMMAFVHSIAFTWKYWTDSHKEYLEEMAKMYAIWGIVATSCGSIMVFQGMLYFRRRWYDAFLAFHICLGVFYVIGLWFHVKDLGYCQVMYPCFAIWVFDRLVRLLRLLWFGFPQGKVSLVADETLVVEIPKPKHWVAQTGGHAWVYFIHGVYFWQSHPFTFVESVEGKSAITFMCKVKKGQTRRLEKRLRSTPGRSLLIRVGVEGPYGEKAPITKHSSVVFIAGGGGITGVFSEVYNAAMRSKDNTTQSLKMVWILRELKLIAWFYRELKALSKTKTQVIVFITRPELGDASELETKLGGMDQTEVASKEKKNGSNTHLLERLHEDMPAIDFSTGRPSLEDLVSSEIDDASSSIAFVSCGHPALVDDLRFNVVRMIEHTPKRVDFFDKSQIWA